MSSLTLERCIYTYLDDDIHEFIFVDDSNTAFDEFLSDLKQILAMHIESGETLRVLIDARHGMPSLMYAAECTKGCFDSYQNLTCRIAFLNQPDSLLTLAAALIGLITGSNTGKFSATFRRDEALSWLVSE
ncbi:MAG: hypothetical protein D6737_16785 [Chloroflexi bacterium]|nr:MAG: hypothetical protein D6737_16785 [Chloroflexota bacterium]